MKKIVLLTNSKGLIPQRVYERESLDLEVLCKVFLRSEFNVEIQTFDKFLNSNQDIKGVYFFYSSSQYIPYKEYILDILIYIQNCGGILIPNFSSFIAHEDKMLQELEMKRLNIPTPDFYIVGTYEEGKEYLKTVSFPVVGKKSKGFGSKTVKKINRFEGGLKFLRKNLTDGFVFNIEYIKWLYKKRKFPKLYPKFHGKVIFQELINDLDHDWKILIFGNKCFVLKRFMKKNDFRASGSGKFDSDATPSTQVLNFAYNSMKKLDVPFASFDIVEKKDRCLLIEYQVVHFGLITALNAKEYYDYDDTKHQWVKKVKNREVDYFFAEAIIDYINSR